MSRAEQLVALGRRRGKQLGHDPRVEVKTPPVQYIEQGFTKFYAVCTCGYASTRRNSHKQALLTVFWHLGKVAAESEEGLNGGAPRRVVPDVEDDQLVGSPHQEDSAGPGRTVKVNPAQPR